ncbi:MAG: hypothetical protein OXI77_11525 [Chloroflexota bacterium]|nr:hypothetical protein [Chloroflexota bacterium]MDE2909568.1 hypothetical protein [Chloroflexota bacterium]
MHRLVLSHDSHSNDTTILVGVPTARRNQLTPKQVISTSDAPAAVGAYSQGVIAGGFVFTAEYIPLIPAALPWPGGG